MPEVVLGVGVLIAAVSLYFMVSPARLRLSLQRIFNSKWLYAVALLRLLLGAVLIASAGSVAYSGLVELAGWLFALGGLLLVVIPQPSLHRLVGWFMELSTALTRFWLILALLFGLFFIYVWSL